MEYPVNVGQQKGYSIAESSLMIKDICGFEGDVTFDTSYTDGDPIKIVGDKKFKSLFKNFVFFDHYEGIRNTVEYYNKII